MFTKMSLQSRESFRNPLRSGIRREPLAFVIACLFSLSWLLLAPQSTLAQRGGQSATTELELKLRVFITSEGAWALDPYHPGSFFGGDGRNFSYSGGSSRIEQLVVVTADPTRAPQVGQTWTNGTVTTHIYDVDQGEHAPGMPWWWWRLRPGQADKPSQMPRTQPVPPLTTVTRENGIITAAFNIHGIRNPYGVYPGPDADITVQLGECGGRVYYRLSGDHNGFPAYEIYLNKTRIYADLPNHPYSLGLFPNVTIDQDWQLLNESTVAFRTTFTELSGGADAELYVRRGDKVTIAAAGKIKFGGFVGWGDPNGLFSDGPFFGLEFCTPFPKIRHGTLMAQIGNQRMGSKRTYVVGKGGTFTADLDGELSLFVNDSCTDDNEGSFFVCNLVSEGR